MKKWEHAVLDYCLGSMSDPLIHLCTTSEGLVSEEVRRTGLKIVFYVLIVFNFKSYCFHLCCSSKKSNLKKF